MKTIVYSYSGKERLDIFISQNQNISRNIAQNLIKKGSIVLNGKVAKSSNVLVQGDIVEIEETLLKKEKEESPTIEIIFENDDILVVNKQAGIVVYPSYGHETGTLLDAVRDKIEIPETDRSGIVHRLDKETSGVLVLARNVVTEEALKKKFAARKVTKIYTALLDGKIVPQEGRVEIPIARSSSDRRKMSSSYVGRTAISEYKVKEYIGKMSLVEIQILTGRTHQIRAHFASLGFPVIGDRVYGPKKQKFPMKRFFLHANCLSFSLKGKKYSFVSPLASELELYLKGVRLEQNTK